MAQCAEAEHTTRWLGFHRVRHGTGEIFDSVDLFLPDVQFPTQVYPYPLFFLPHASFLKLNMVAPAFLAQAICEVWFSKT